MCFSLDKFILEYVWKNSMQSSSKEKVIFLILFI